MGRLAGRARDAGVTVVHLTYLPLADGRSPAGGRRSCAPRPRRRPGASPIPRSRSCPRSGSGRTTWCCPRHQGISPVHRTEVLTMLRNMGMEHSWWPVSRPTSPSPHRGRRRRRGLRRDGGDGRDRRHAARAPRVHARHSLAFVARLATTDELLADWVRVRTRARLGRPGDGLGLEVLLESLDPALATDPAVLVAAVGRVRPVPEAAVDADGAGADASGDGGGPLLGRRRPRRRRARTCSRWRCGRRRRRPRRGSRTRTGPKISSWAMVMELSTSTKSVGSTNQPLGRCAGRPPPTTSLAPSSCPFSM